MDSPTLTLTTDKYVITILNCIPFGQINLRKLNFPAENAYRNKQQSITTSWQRCTPVAIIRVATRLHQTRADDGNFALYPAFNPL